MISLLLHSIGLGVFPSGLTAVLYMRLKWRGCHNSSLGHVPRGVLLLCFCGDPVKLRKTMGDLDPLMMQGLILLCEWQFWGPFWLSPPTQLVSCTWGSQWSWPCSSEQHWALTEEYFYPIIKSIQRKCSKRMGAALAIKEPRYPIKPITALNSNPSLFSIPLSFQDKDFSVSEYEKGQNQLESCRNDSSSGVHEQGACLM